MKFQAVIFDLDGTIIDTTGIIRKVMENLFAKRGIHVSKEEIKRLEDKLRNVGLDVACSIVRKETSISDPNEILMKEINELACELYKKDLSFVPGFEDFYKKISEHHIKTAVATNADYSTLDHAKKSLKLEHFFGDHIYDIASVDYAYKPDPAIYRHAAKKLSVIPTKCIAIEDSPRGITAAQTAGMFCIAINTSGIRESLSKANLVVDSYNQIDFETLLKNN